jgi:nicotinamide-nucleotide amidase
LPQKAKILKNNFGTASGMWFDHRDKVVISLPGVPYEMKALMEEEVLTALKSRFDLPHILHKTVLTYGLGESVIASRIEAWEQQLPKSIKLAYLPSLGRVRLRLSTKGSNLEELQSAMDQQIAQLIPLIEDVYFGVEEAQPIEVQIGNRLKEKKQTLSCAESCTGGTIASRITAHAGASQFFKGSAVTYVAEAKTHFLGVPQELIQKEGVVSAAVAAAMAKGAKKEFQTDYALGITGNAGPTTEPGAAVVGTVFIALATPQGVHTEEFMLGNHRERVIQKAVNKAFELLYHSIK